MGRVMLVEDEVDNLRLVTAMLQKAGYEVVSTQDPFKALPLLRLCDPSAVLLDYNMPGKDGLALLEEIRKESHLPVIMLTAADKADLAVRALRLGAFDYLTKPVDEQRLLSTLKAAIAAEDAQDDRIGRYRIERELGRGGMGVVYAGRDLELHRGVALKILLPELAADPHYENSFLREARAAAQFSHPNIVIVYDADRYRGRLYLAMELVQGKTLQALTRGAEPLEGNLVLRVGVQAAEAMEAVHAAGMVHRDLKPSNLMLSDAGAVKILDFGLVRPSPSAEASGGEKVDFAGTMAYAPPELFRGAIPDPRADIYGLGVVLYELLARKTAFSGDSQFDLMAKISEGRVARPWEELGSIPRPALDFIRRMMNPRPEGRPASMKEVAASLRSLSGPPARTGSPGS